MKFCSYFCALCTKRSLQVRDSHKNIREKIPYVVAGKIFFNNMLWFRLKISENPQHISRTDPYWILHPPDKFFQHKSPVMFKTTENTRISPQKQATEVNLQRVHSFPTRDLRPRRKSAPNPPATDCSAQQGSLSTPEALTAR